MFTEQDVQAALTARDFADLMDGRAQGGKDSLTFGGSTITMDQVRRQEVPAAFVQAVQRGCVVLAAAHLEYSLGARDHKPRGTDLSPHVADGARYAWLEAHDYLSRQTRQLWPKIAAALNQWMEA